MMLNNAPSEASAAGSLYHDLNGLNDLKRASRDDPNAAIDKVAKQFESMFIQMMLKSMRDALPKEGLFSSNDMETYTEMADQQIAVNMAESGGIGLADVIARQLRPDTGVSKRQQEAAVSHYRDEGIKADVGIKLQKFQTAGDVTEPKVS
ncbi:MAG: rod-binding protein [Pseudomonadales bacterium]